MSVQAATKSTDPGIVEQIEIFSNKNEGKSIDLTGGFSSLTYIESIMSDTIKVNYTFIDTGKGSEGKTVTEALPLVGQERVVLKFTDNNENTIGGKKQLTLYVNKITPVSDSTTESILNLELVSKEYIMNEKKRVTKRMDGKLSDHIKNILTSKDYLGTEKTVDIEDTINNYNFFGNNKKPFYTISWLAKKGVSAKSQSLGKNAGYFFYETYEGFFFKSIDGLLEQKPKAKTIFNNTVDFRGENIPEGKDFKTLKFQKNNNVNVQEKLKMGAFSNRTVVFDPFTCYYEVITPNVTNNADSSKLAGKELYLNESRNKEFDSNKPNEEFSRTTYYLLDKGTAPTGDSKQQIEKSEEENFDYKKILNQSLMRYNQFFSSTAGITIPGNFALHAGDMIHIDLPGLEKKDNPEVDKKDGGLYIITDICHTITPDKTLTRCNLARDSFGRKPIER
tara:strand:+ start:416 stop:1762 length:1347 start_codon:yes stop_codon:yes gene_type:complete